MILTLRLCSAIEQFSYRDFRNKTVFSTHSFYLLKHTLIVLEKFNACISI